MNSASGTAYASEPASAEVLCTVAHELRQPLSGIETIAYYLSLVLPRDDEKVQTQLEEIRRLVEQASRILNHSVTLVSGAGSRGEATPLSQSEAEAAGDAATLGDQRRRMLP